MNQRNFVQKKQTKKKTLSDSQNDTFCDCEYNTSKDLLGLPSVTIVIGPYRLKYTVSNHPFICFVHLQDSSRQLNHSFDAKITVALRAVRLKKTQKKTYSPTWQHTQHNKYRKHNQTLSVFGCFFFSICATFCFICTVKTGEYVSGFVFHLFFFKYFVKLLRMFSSFALCFLEFQCHC